MGVEEEIELLKWNFQAWLRKCHLEFAWILFFSFETILRNFQGLSLVFSRIPNSKVTKPKVSGFFSDSAKIASVRPIFKKGEKTEIGNHRS